MLFSSLADIEKTGRNIDNNRRMSKSAFDIPVNHFNLHELGNNASRLSTSLFTSVDEVQKFYFDNVLSSLGKCGKHQIFLFCLMGIPQFLTGALVFEIIFLSSYPDFTCMQTNGSLTNSSDLDFIINNNFTLPALNKSDSRTCRLYESRTLSCSSLEFSREYYGNTIVTEFDLVCSNQKYVTFVKTLSFVGRLIGSLSCGIVSDRFGRKLTLIIYTVVVLVSGLIVPFANSYALFCVGYFIRTFANGGIYVVSGILAIESFVPSKRKFIGVLFNMFYVSGTMTTVILAYFLRDWRYLAGIITLPAGAILFYSFFITESPRWLLSQGRKADTVLRMKTIAKINGKCLSPKNIYLIERECDLRKADRSDESEILLLSKVFFKTVFLHWFMCRIASTVWLSTFACSLGFYVLAFNQENLSGNPYLNFFFFALSQASCYIFCFIMVDKVGRKPLSMFSCIVGGIISIFIQYVPKNYFFLQTIISMMSQFLISLGYTVVLFLAIEIYPTPIRNFGYSLNTLFSRTAGGLAPIILDLRFFYEPLPLLIMAVFIILSGCCLIQVPETSGRILPETVDELKSRIQDDDDDDD